VLGDGKYGDFQLNKELKKTAGLKRMLLHAASLSLPGLPPADAPLPDYFRAFLEKAGIVF
jgi:hypothetical protein